MEARQWLTNEAEDRTSGTRTDEPSAGLANGAASQRARAKRLPKSPRRRRVRSSRAGKCGSCRPRAIRKNRPGAWLRGTRSTPLRQCANLHQMMSGEQTPQSRRACVRLAS